MVSCLAEFKSWVAKLYSSSRSEFNDSDTDVVNLFRSIEKIFNSGLKDLPNLFFESKQYCWDVFERLPNFTKEFDYEVPYSVSMALYEVSHNTRVKKPVGKGRLFLRILAKNGSLGDLVLLLKENRKFLYRFYNSSILTNDIQSQIFYSIVSDFSRFKFNLTIDHADFLDYTWEIPIYRTKDFVPCSRLGVRIQVLNTYYVVTELEEGYQEDNGKFFEVGDVIASMAGNPLRGKAVDLHKTFVKECRKLLRFEIVKVRGPNGAIFKPIMRILKEAGFANILKPPEIDKSKEDQTPKWPEDEALDISACYTALGATNTEGPESPSESKIAHTIRYVGCVDMGTRSEKSHINGAIERAINNNPSASHYMPVRVKLGELDVSFWPLKSDSTQPANKEAPWLKFAYPSISSVGLNKDARRYFGLIVGNSSCCVATNFTAHVFLALTAAESASIVRGITVGFQRTNWAM